MDTEGALPIGEARLVAAARGGDRTAFAALVRDASPMLERLALRVLGHRQDAEDAAQEAIVDAWRALPRFRGEARFRTWIYRILVARALDVARRRRPVDEIPATAACAAHGPAEDASAHDLETRIRGAIDGLPHAQRTVLLLRTDHGMSYDEIAYVMGTGRDAVRVNLIEARRRLARALRGVVDLGGEVRP